MRVALVVNADWFFLSHRLALGRALQSAGYDVSVIAGDTGRGAEIEEAGLRYIPWTLARGGVDPFREAKSAAALFAAYRRLRPDIVHHVTLKSIIYGTAAARGAGVRRQIQAVAGLGYAFTGGQDGARRIVLRGALTLALRACFAGAATRVVVQNPDDRAAVVRVGARPEQVRMIRGSGVDLDRFALQPMPTHGQDPVVMLPARLLWDKGVAEFVEAARIVRQRGTPARFVLVGRIDEQNPAAIPRSVVDGWVGEGVVEWWGARPNEAMPSTYGAASLVVLPSYREGMPLALAEAAAVGRPIITTDVPGCRETLPASQSLWLVPPRNAGRLAAAIEEELRQTKEERAVRIAALRAHTAANLSLGTVIEATLALYSELARL